MFVVVNRRTKLKLLLFLCLAALLVGAGVFSPADTARLSSGDLRPISKFSVKEQLVSLTFDLTYGETAPDEVLDVLKSKGIRATFFVGGPWAAAHPDVVKRIVRENHDLGSQGYWHENLSTCENSRIMLSLARTHELLKGIAGVEPSLFRPPNGNWNGTVLQTAQEVGYRTITWSLDSLDWRNKNERDIATKVVREAKPGDVIRFHASDLSGQTTKALPLIILELTSKGFRFVPVSEALKATAQ